MKNKKYNHAEAFCVMSYECEECGHVERIWNSRDGITPFVVCCRLCDGSSIHVRWNRDNCIPDYEPDQGERIFVDFTEERAKKIAMEIIENYKGTKFEIPEEDYQKFIDSFIESCKMNADLKEVD